ncbi:hypothetical protein F5144DRAFT_595806 [Chaetomium tenue]|uniref:Uncharacterized protein n=1 Tax=Chaetomium tenue TaxID=1854479 RepID=A0ACB7NZH8_9PEZI|nr:hypothetical protein F5144DRAFT_595806 [Chaetomium globosum]
MRSGYQSGSAEDKLLGPQLPVQRPCFLIVETRDMHPLALCLVMYCCETKIRDLDMAHPLIVVEARRVAGSSGSGGGLIDIRGHALLGAVG